MKEYWIVKIKRAEIDGGDLYRTISGGVGVRREAAQYGSQLRALQEAANSWAYRDVRVVRVTVKKKERKPVGWVNYYPNLGLSCFHKTEEAAMDAAGDHAETFPVYR